MSATMVEFEGHVFDIIEDEMTCRKLMLDHAATQIAEHAGHGSVAAGPLLGNDPKGFMVCYPRDGVVKFRAYMFREKIDAKDAMKVIVRMAKLLAEVLEAPLQLQTYSAEDN